MSITEYFADLFKYVAFYQYAGKNRLFISHKVLMKGLNKAGSPLQRVHGKRRKSTWDFGWSSPKFPDSRIMRYLPLNFPFFPVSFT